MFFGMKRGIYESKSQYGTVPGRLWLTRLTLGVSSLKESATFSVGESSECLSFVFKELGRILLRAHLF